MLGNDYDYYHLSNATIKKVGRVRVWGGGGGATLSQGFLIIVTNWEVPFPVLPCSKGKVPGTKLGWGRSPSRGTTRLFRLSFVPCYDISLPENFSCSNINSISAFF